MGKKKSSTRRSAASAQKSSQREASTLPAVPASISRHCNDIEQQVAQLASGPVAACFKGQQLDSVCDSISALACNVAQQACHLDEASAAEQLQQLSVLFRQLQLPQLLVKLLRARKGAGDWQQPEYSSSIGSVLGVIGQLVSASASLDGGAGQAARCLVTPEALAEAATALKELALLLQEQQQQQQHQASKLLWLSIQLLYWWQTAVMLSNDVTAGVHAQALGLTLQPAAALTCQVAQGMLGSSIRPTAYVAVLSAVGRLLLHVDDCVSKQPATADAFRNTQHPAFLHLRLMELTIHLHKLQCLTAAAVAESSCSEANGDSQGVGHSSSSPGSSSSRCSSSYVICPGGSSSHSCGASFLSAAGTATPAVAPGPEPSFLADLILQVWQALGMSPSALPCFSAALESMSDSSILVKPVQPPCSMTASSQAQTEAGQYVPPCTGAQAAPALLSAIHRTSSLLHLLRGGNSTNPASAATWGQLSAQHQQLLRVVSWLMPPLLLGTALHCGHNDAQAVKAATNVAGLSMEYWGTIGEEAAVDSAMPAAAAAAAAADGQHPPLAAHRSVAAAAAVAGSHAEHTATVVLSATLHSWLPLLNQQLTGSGYLAALASNKAGTGSSSSSSSTTSDDSSSAVAGCDSITLNCRHAAFASGFLVILCRAAQLAGGSWSACVGSSQADSIMATLELLMRRVHCCNFVCDGSCGNNQAHCQQQQQESGRLQQQQPLQQEQQLQQPGKQKEQQLCNMQVAGVVCKAVNQLHDLLAFPFETLLKAHATMLTTGPCWPVPWAGWLQQQQQWQRMFSLAVTCIKLCRTSQASVHYYRYRTNLHCISLAAAEVVRALSKSSPCCFSSLQQRQAALAPWGMLYGLVCTELGLLLKTVRTEVEQLHRSSCSSSNAAHTQHEGDCGVAACGEAEDCLNTALESVQTVISEIGDSAEAFQSTFCQVWSLDGDQLGQATGQEMLQRQFQQQKQSQQQQQQQEEEKAGCTAASAAPGLAATGAAIPSYDLASALFLRHEHVVSTARQAAAAVQAARTNGSHTSNEDSQLLHDCSCGNTVGSHTSHRHAGSGHSHEGSSSSSSSSSSNGSGSGGERMRTAIGSAASPSCSTGTEGKHVAAVQPASSPHEVMSVLLQCPALNELPQLLQETGEALCVSLPVSWLCNNLSCTNLACSSEHLLVGGKGCVCGSCRIARYCGRACQAAHWKRHKPVCRRMAAEAAAAAEAGFVSKAQRRVR